MQIKKWKKYTVILPYLVALIVFLLLYRYSFPQGDDFTFSSRGGTLPRIWNYYIYYYTYAGSRMANLFASLLLMAGLSIWKVLTPFVMEGTSLLLFYCVTGQILPREGRLKHDISLACVCAFFPGLVPVAYHLFADTFLWMDGSCNYLYPMFFLLLGFLPFWNALRGRPLPRPLKWICPVFFLAAGLMHEQTAMALFVFCAVALLWMRKNRRPSGYLRILFGISTAVMVFTFTCPGAYYRVGRTNTNPKLSLLHRLFRNLLNYFSQFGHEMWIFAFLLGLCALYFLRKNHGKFATVLTFFIASGVVLAPLSQVFPFLALQSNLSHNGPRTVLLLLYWLLFTVALIPGFLIPAHRDPANRYVSALYLCILGSQAIPIAIGCTGRPLLPFVILTMLLVLCAADGISHRLVPFMQTCMAFAGFCAIAFAFLPAASNYAAFRDIEKQVAGAKSGQVKAVYFNQGAFNSNYCYFNAFGSTYCYDLQQYYGIDKKVNLLFSARPKSN